MFNKGLLYVRCHNDNICDLFYVESDIPDEYDVLRGKRIAEMKFELHGEPNFDYFDEPVHTGTSVKLGTDSTLTMVTLAPAQDSDIKMVFEYWHKRFSLRAWMANVNKERLLAPAEKERIARIVEPYFLKES